MEEKALTPVKQALVPFYGIMILAVLLPDGRIAASLKSLCNALKLASQPQIRRIRNDAALTKELLLVITETPGGPQATEVLTAKAIPLWLTGLQPNMVAPEKRPLIQALKEEAMEVLYRHFFKIDADEKAAPPPNPSAEAPRSQRKMAHKAFERLHQVADALQQAGDTIYEAADALRAATDELDEIYMVAQEEKEAMGDHIVALEVKQKALEERKAGSATQARKQPLPQDGPILTAEHRNQVYALARHLRDQTGEPLAAMFAELAEVFGVADMSDIPDAGWEEVATWFWERRQRTVVEEQR
jgi:hypothetical protein